MRQKSVENPTWRPSDFWSKCSSVDWYGYVIYCHFNVDIGAVVLPVIYGCRHSPQALLCCCGLPYVVIVVVFFTFGVWCKFPSCTDCLESFSACCELCSLIMFWDCCFPNAHWFRWDCIIRLGVFPPMIVFVVTLWGCCRLFKVVLATVGPRTTQESFPVLSWNWWLIACVQWLAFGLHWEQGWGLGLLDKPGGWKPQR